jgi:LuxR family maltose regulon positive regulatory protein
LPRTAERSRQAIDLAERRGWTDDPAAGIAYTALGGVLAWQGRLDEAEPWVQRAERTIRAEADPAAALSVRYFRGALELACGRTAGALATFRTAERLAGPYPLAGQIRAWLLHTLVRLGNTERAEHFLAGLGEPDRAQAGAVGSARALGLLAPSARPPAPA